MATRSLVSPLASIEAAMTKGLRVSNLRLNVSASGDDIVDEVQFAIEPGKVLALVGVLMVPLSVLPGE